MENLKQHLESQLHALERQRVTKTAEFDRQRDAALESIDQDIEKTEIQLAAEMRVKPAELRKQRRAAAKVQVATAAASA